ncbi:acetoin utilization protein AcuC [Nesterenkonia populi]
MTRTAALPSTAVVWDPALLDYRFTAAHPMDPVRLELTEQLCAQLGVLDAENVITITPELATAEQLGSIHEAGYLDAVREADANGVASEEHGLGTEDTPVFPQMHQGAARIAGGTAALAEGIASGRFARGVNFAGGMHHAHAGRAGGFCIYNDVALAAQTLLDAGFRRIAYIDVDAHHGDGTQQIFYADPRVMTVSVHQSGANLFPFSGYPNETGTGEAAGMSVNLALPEETDDAGFLRGFHALVPAVLDAFEPEVILSQHGADAHAQDPMSDLRLSLEGQRRIALDIAELAERHCAGRWIATGGGGYAVHGIVPRAWTHLTAVVAGSPIPPDAKVPRGWQEELTHLGVDPPTSMGDGAEPVFRSWEDGYDPENAVDRAIIQTRKEIFPLWGLDPYYD